MIPHPSYRSRSRQSTASTNPDIDSLHSWSRSMGPRNGGGGSTTTVTSVWSDDGATVLPSSEEGVWGRAGPKQEASAGRGNLRRGSTPAGEKPLIELDSDYESYPTRRSFPSAEAGPSSPPLPVTRPTKPSEELRRLLRQMEDEVKSTTPVEPVSPIKRPTSLPSQQSAQVPRSPPVSSSQRRANWREGRRIGVYPPVRDGESSPERDGGDGEEEVESPPTPPVRITNPYLYSARKTSDPTTLQSKHRISSRAAVLQNSTSRSPPPTSPPTHHSPSPLETFIATQPVPLDPSSSRSPPSFRSSGSRKGKERADPTPPPSIPAPLPSSASRPLATRSYTPRRESSSSDDIPRMVRPTPTTARERPRRTPRRQSVELAPDDSEVFAQELEVDEIGVDLDEEEEGLGRPWDSETGSGSGSGAEYEGGDGLGEYDERDDRRDNDQTTRGGPSRHSPTTPLSGPAYSPRSPNRSREDSSRLSRLLNVERTHRRETSTDVSLPYLSDPDDADGAEGQGESLSERRAGLFRSGSRAGRETPSPIPQPQGARLSVSPRYTARQDRSGEGSLSQSRISGSTSQSFATTPVRVGMSLTPPHPQPNPVYLSPAPAAAAPPPGTPTPPRPSGEAITAPTPHPPGWLQRSPAPAPSARAVRFSPLRQTDKDWSLSQGTTSSTAEISVHRLKFSPKRSPAKGSPLRSNSTPPLSASKSADGDTSFTGRISRFLLPPSTTLRDASTDLERARRLSEVAQAKVEESQRAWSEALSELGRSAGEAGKRGARWGRWGWWILVEVLLLWCVFRVTVDYTANLNPPSNSFTTLNLNPHALSTRIPGTLSAFVIPRESANFFDLMERYEVWKRVEGMAKGMGAISVGDSGEGGAWGIGGVGGMRMVGGVPS